MATFRVAEIEMAFPIPDGLHAFRGPGPADWKLLRSELLTQSLDSELLTSELLTTRLADSGPPSAWPTVSLEQFWRRVR